MDELTEFEKLIQNINQFASLMRAYYEALIESGFLHEDAMNLTIQYQKELLGLSKKSS